MRSRTIALVCVSVLSVASSVPARGQSGESLTALQTAVACQSPPVLTTEPTTSLHIVGSQDVVGRSTFGMPEVLVLDGGTGREVRVNDVYFVRRLFRTAETQRDKLPHTVQTIGWVRIVAANDRTSLASPEHTCSDIRSGDYLEPFVAPVAMDGATLTTIVQSELNFGAHFKVLHGELEHRTTGTNEFATIEHGFDRNIKVGARFAIYRDLQLPQNPLKRIGEAIAVSVGPSMTLVRVTSARDAIFTGDYMVPRTADGATAEPQASEAADRLKVAAPNPLSGCQNEGRVPPQNPRCAG